MNGGGARYGYGNTERYLRTIYRYQKILLTDYIYGKEEVTTKGSRQDTDKKIEKHTRGKIKWPAVRPALEDIGARERRREKEKE